MVIRNVAAAVSSEPIQLPRPADAVRRGVGVVADDPQRRIDLPDCAIRRFLHPEIGSGASIELKVGDSPPRLHLLPQIGPRLIPDDVFPDHVAVARRHRGNVIREILQVGGNDRADAVKRIAGKSAHLRPVASGCGPLRSQEERGGQQQAVGAVELQFGVAETPPALFRFQIRPRDVIGPGVMQPDMINTGGLERLQYRIVCDGVNAERRLRRVPIPADRARDAGHYEFKVRRNLLSIPAQHRLHPELAQRSVGKYAVVDHAIFCRRQDEAFLPAIEVGNGHGQLRIRHAPGDMARKARRFGVELNPRRSQFRIRQCERNFTGSGGPEFRIVARSNPEGVE